MITYSVIIPHHNTPDLLENCLNSIPQRDDIQVIVVDDNSNPAKVDFNNFPGKDRENVEIIFNKIGKGAGHARNLALEKAKGKWLFFVDADDFIAPNGFEILDRHVDSDADIVYVGADSIFLDTKEQASRHVTIMSLLEKTQKLNTAEGYEYLRLTHVNPIAKMIRRSIVGEIRFDEVRYSNDVMFAVKVGWIAKKVEVDLDVVYMITVSVGSLTNRRNLDNYMSRYDVYLRHNEFMRSIGKKQYQRSFMYFYLKTCKYGFKSFYHATKLMIQYKGNPFLGCGHWVDTIIRIRKQKAILEKYRVP